MKATLILSALLAFSSTAFAAEQVNCFWTERGDDGHTIEATGITAKIVNGELAGFKQTSVSLFGPGKTQELKEMVFGYTNNEMVLTYSEANDPNPTVYTIRAKATAESFYQGNLRMQVPAGNAYHFSVTCVIL